MRAWSKATSGQHLRERTPDPALAPPPAGPCSLKSLHWSAGRSQVSHKEGIGASLLVPRPFTPPHLSSRPSPMFAYFLVAQAPIYATALAELRAERPHWMWFIFPQLTALGRSATAQRYGLAARRCAGLPRRSGTGAAANSVSLPCWRSKAGARARSSAPPTTSSSATSITLFEAAAEDADKPLFAAALERYYDGVRAR